MSGNIGEKARGAFLALIMVTSVMVGTVAFAGSAAAVETDDPAPAVTDDLDVADGNGQQQTVTFSLTPDTLATDTSDQTITIGVSSAAGGSLSAVSVDSASVADQSGTSLDLDSSGISGGTNADDATLTITRDSNDAADLATDEQIDISVTFTVNGADNEDATRSASYDITENGNFADFTAADGDDAPEFSITDTTGDVVNVDAGVNTDGVTYTTIQDAVNDANEGETIEIQTDSITPGSTVVVDKAVTITTGPNSAPTVDGSNNDIVFDIRSGGVTISDIGITGASGNDVGVSVRGSVTSGDTISVSGNTFESLLTGVQTKTGSTVPFEVTDNTFQGTIAVGVSDQTGTTTVSDNTFDSTETNVAIAGTPASVTNNDITFSSSVASNDEVPVGIHLQSGADTEEVSGNSITGAERDVVFGSLFTTSGENPPDSVAGYTDLNEQIRYVVENNDITTTKPHGVILSTEGITVGNSETVNVEVYGLDADAEDIDYALVGVNPGGSFEYDADGTDDGDNLPADNSGTPFPNSDDVITSGTSSDGSFSVLVGANSVGDYRIVTEGTSSDIDGTETITSTYTVDNLSVEPADPTFEADLTVTGTLVDGDGNVPETEQPVVLANDDGSNQLASTTTQNGEFLVSATANDAGTYVLADEVDGTAYAEFTVDPQQANVTLTAGGNEAGFEQTYEITLKDGDGNQLDFSNGAVDGFVNVTGPFEAGTVDSFNNEDSTQIIDADDSDDVVEAVRIKPDTDAEDESISFDATPVDTDSDVTATLENNGDNGVADTDATVYGGAEETSAIATFDSPDYVGSDSLAVTSAGNLNVDVNQDEVAALDGGSQFDISIRGADGAFPDGTGDDSNALDTASVSITGPGIDLSEEDFNSGTANSDLTDAATVDEDNNEIEFTGVEADQAGTITIEVTALADDGTEYNDTLTVDVTGDIIESVSPSSAQIDDNENVTIQVTNADGTPVNNRVVELTSSSGAELTVYDQENSETLTGVTTLTIDGAAGEITADGGDADGSAIVTGVSVNNGEYTAQNITFSATGSFDVTVNPADATAQETGAISVTGLEAYEVTSNRTAALAGANEVHTLNITEDGAEVNGTDLDDFSASYSDDMTEISGPTPVDLDDDGTNDALEVEIRAENASALANITLDDGEARTGTASLDVVEPDISTTLAGDDLTFGLVSEMNVTVEDPRDGSGIDSAEVNLDAVNATFQYDGDLSDDSVDLGDVADDTTVTVNENGTLAIAAAPEAGTADAAPQTLNLSVSLDDNDGTYGEVAVDTGNITADVPDDLEPNTEESLVLEVVDANGAQLDLLGVELAGSGLDGEDQQKVTDEGFVNFDFTTADSGTITYTADDSISSNEVTLVTGDDSGTIQFASTNVFEQVNLSLSANQTDIAQNDTVEFTLVREDFDQETAGTLTIYNSSDAVVDTVSIDGTANVTFDEAGEFMVEADKDTRPSVGKAFFNDSVTVTVEEAVEPGQVQLENVTLEPNTVTANTTNAHTLTFDATNVSDDGNTDTFTVTIPDAATLESLDDASVVDANGETVQIEGSDVSGNVITVDVAPDSSAETRDLTVTANVTVSAPDVANETAADIQIDVSDSDRGSDSANATLTIQAQDQAQDPVERFDTNGDPGIQSDEVLNAISAFNEDEEGVEAGDVLDVISAFNEA